MRPRIDLTDFIVNGRFGPFDRDTDAGTIIAALGPSDPWVTYPKTLGYGNVGFEIVDAPDASCRLLVQFAFQHPERFRLLYESWRANAEPAWQKLLFDWPDSRFDFALGPFRSGATLDLLYDDFFADVEEAEFMDTGSAPSLRVFDMPSGVSVMFSNTDMDGEYTLLHLMTMSRWGPDCCIEPG